MTIYTACTHCRICGNPNLVDLIDLGSQALTSIFPHQDEPSPPFAPQALVKCDDEHDPSACGLVQMKHTVDASHLYTDNYGYRSGLNATMTQHLAHIASQLETLVPLSSGDIILDIGANDATLLSKYQTLDVIKLAIDPSGTQFKQYYPDNVRLVPEFFNKTSFTEAMSPNAKAKIVTTISMFYDLPSPQDFTNDVAAILHPDGIWLMEQSYMPSMIENLSFDTICHEHLEYYTLKQIEFMAARAGLRVVDMSLNDCNGGSFRVTLCHKDAPYHSNTPALANFRKAEIAAGWHTPTPYRQFEAQYNLQRDALMAFLRQQKRDHKTIAIYGASTKGNTLLQYYGIGTDLVTCVAERNPRKFGHKTPGTNIPITSEEEVRALKPDYMLVLPWHFKAEFLKREQQYLQDGGTFVFPLPQFDLVSNSPLKTAVIIGASGQVGTYLTTLLLSRDYRVFALSRKPSTSLQHPNLVNIPIDATNFPLLDATLQAIKPQEIYNLAAVTDSNISIANPVHTHTLNATLTTQLVASIKKLPTPCRFFQANSTEIFKGHPTATYVNEESLPHTLHPTTPYAVAKVASYWTVKLAREQDGIYAVSGMCSNIESRFRRPSYITRKIADYFIARQFQTPLRIGNATSMCDWIHASDVAHAIYASLQQPHPTDYIFSSGTLQGVTRFASEVALQCNIPASWNEDHSLFTHDIDGTTLIAANDPQFVRPYEKTFASKPIFFSNAKMQTIYSPTRSSLADIVTDMLRGLAP